MKLSANQNTWSLTSIAKNSYAGAKKTDENS